MVLVRFGNTPLERKPLEFEPDEDLSCLAYYQINPQVELDKIMIMQTIHSNYAS